MTLRVLMTDIDGVLVHPWSGGHWSDGLEADLGLSPQILQRAFFDPFWDDVAQGRGDLHARPAPVLARIAPHLTSRTLLSDLG